MGPPGPSGPPGPPGPAGASAGITSYTNPADNRVITSVSSTTINAESNLTFDGSVLTVTGTITETSTERAKENIEEINNPLYIVKKLRGVEYNKIGNSIKEIGLIAEEVDKVLPQVVIKDYEGNPSSVSYSRITAILIEAIKIQDQQIENLTKRVEVLEK
jgi:Ni,Fe-hydrogenase III small subunit